MELREYSNPEERDYDVKTSLSSVNNVSSKNDDNERRKRIEELVDLVGFLEDGEWVNYGITENEYFNPTAATIKKVSEKLNSKQNERNR